MGVVQGHRRQRRGQVVDVPDPKESIEVGIQDRDHHRHPVDRRPRRIGQPAIARRPRLPILRPVAPRRHKPRQLLQHPTHDRSLHPTAHRRIARVHDPTRLQRLVNQSQLRRQARLVLEGTDARVPIAGSSVRLSVVILIGVPERALVGRVQIHRTVVAPPIARPAAAVVFLRAAPGDELHFGLWQRVGRIRHEPSRIGDAGKVRRRCVRRRVAQRHVALPVHREAAHEAIERRVRRVDLLLQRNCRHGAAGNVDLRPLHGGRSRRGPHRVSHPQRLDAAELAVLHLLHDAVVDHVQEVATIRLRDDRTLLEGVRGLAYVCRRAERSATAAIRASREFPDFERK